MKPGHSKLARRLILAALAATLAAPAVAKKLSVEERLQRIATAYDSKDCKPVVKFAAPLAAPNSTALPEPVLADLFDLLVGCELDLKMEEAAYAHALRATALEHSSDYLWRVRLASEVQAERFDAAVATIESMTQGRGAALNSVPVQWMWRIVQGLRKEKRTELSRRLLAVLSSDAYAPDDLSEPPDDFRAAYAHLLVEAGDTAAARAIVARIDSQYALAHAMLDPDLRPFVSPTADHRAAAERSLERHREAMARHPDRLGPLREVAAALRYLGKPDEALKLLDSAAGRIEDPKAFEDRAREINWYWDEVARAHSAAGRYEQAVAAFRKGAAASEGGTPNVSQVINLASAQVDYGRPEEALKTLAAFDDGRLASPYGYMEMHLARGCAHAAMGHSAEAAADLDYMRAHEADNPSALTNILLCVGDMDGAAASIIRRLSDSNDRVGALADLSEYDDPPFKLPADPIVPKLEALKARADVKAAIARAGGIRRFHVQRGEF